MKLPDTINVPREVTIQFVPQAPAPKARRTNGAGAAAVLAAGIGSAALGVATVLAVASPPIKHALAWYAPAGPLSGKTGVAVIAWLLAWAGLHLWWRRREVNFKDVWLGALLLLAAGFILTFPPVFEAFER